MHFVIDSSHSDLIVPTHIPGRTPPTPNHTLMNKLRLFIKYGSLIKYNIFSGFNHSADLTLTDGTIFFLAKFNAWIYTVIQNLNTKNINDSGRQKQQGEVFAKLL